MLKQKPVFCAITLLVTFLILPVSTLYAQGKEMGAGWCGVSGHGNYTGASCPKCAAGTNTNSTYNGPNLWNMINNAKEKKAEKAQSKILNKANALISESRAANNRGLVFWNNEEWANAAIAFQEAVDKDPDDKNTQDNLADAKEKLRLQQEEQQQIQQNKTAVGNMQQSIQNFTQTLKTVPSTGGLDFDGKNTNSTLGKTTTNTELQFGDPNVVDARNVPSGLPKAIDDAIAGVYKNAPIGVSDRVRKGCQAVMTKDWKVAKAWFLDALNLDPNNEGLKKFIALCDYTPGTKPVNNTISEKIPVPAIFTYVPTSEEIKAYWENMKESEKGGFLSLPNKASAFSDQFRKYVYSLNAEDAKKFDAFCEYTVEIKLDKNIPLQQIPVPATEPYVPTSQEIEAFQTNNRLLKKEEFWKPLTIPPGGFSEKFKKYIYSLNEDEMKKFLSIQLPEEKDIELLFPMTLPPVSKWFW